MKILHLQGGGTKFPTLSEWAAHTDFLLKSEDWKGGQKSNFTVIKPVNIRENWERGL